MTRRNLYFTEQVINVPSQNICMNGDSCDKPHCPDHWPYDRWRKEYWPAQSDPHGLNLSMPGDPWWDGLQSQSDYRRMHRYFDVRGGTVSW
jgi:hypothetical protein